MLDESVKSLDEQSVALMGLPLHVRGDHWPKLPFYGADEHGVFIRWNDNDIAFIEHTTPKGLVDKETVEFWHPSYRVEQAMRLWSEYPPERHWVQVQIGKDGWTVELLYHHEKVIYLKTLIADDDTNDSMAKAITKAWIIAMEAS